MFREAGNITVYDSEYEYYCGDSYGSDVLIESMDKDKTYYFVIQYSHNSGTDQAIMIEKEKNSGRLSGRYLKHADCISPVSG